MSLVFQVYRLYNSKLAVTSMISPSLCVCVGTFPLRVCVCVCVGLGLRASFDRASSQMNVDVTANLNCPAILLLVLQIYLLHRLLLLSIDNGSSNMSVLHGHFNFIKGVTTAML